HPLLLNLLENGYDAFTKEAMEERRIAMLPPYTNHILIRSEDHNNQDSRLFLQNVRQYIAEHPQSDAKLW
ncbi:primosomal protein, partial [Vibrio parahaemolyticus]